MIIVGKVYPYRPRNLTRSARPSFIHASTKDTDLDGRFVMVRSIRGDIAIGQFVSGHPIIETDILYSFHIDQLGDRPTSNDGGNYIARNPVNGPGPMVKHV